MSLHIPNRANILSQLIRVVLYEYLPLNDAFSAQDVGGRLLLRPVTGQNLVGGEWGGAGGSALSRLWRTYNVVHAVMVTPVSQLE